MRRNNQAAIRLVGECGNRALDLDTAMGVNGSHLDIKRWRHRLGRSISTVATESEPKSTAARRILGAASLSSPSHLPPMASSKFWNPLIFAPGRARLATKPLLTGSETWVNTIGIVLVSLRNSANAVQPATTITSGVERTSSAADAFSRLASPATPAILDLHVAALRPTQPLQCVEKRCDASLTFAIGQRVEGQHADPPHPFPLLRARLDRPRNRRASDHLNEIASPHCLPRAQDHAISGFQLRPSNQEFTPSGMGFNG